MEKKTYKNLLNQPLPIALNSEGICVAPRQEFEVSKDDWNSPDIYRFNKQKKIKEVTKVKVEVAQSEPEETTPPVEPVESESTENDSIETEQEQSEEDKEVGVTTEPVSESDEKTSIDKKDSDNLTESSKMVESGETPKGEAIVTKKKKKRGKSTKRGA